MVDINSLRTCISDFHNFDSVLIANRGEIACRIIKTANKLGYRTIAIYTDADKKSPHVALADEAINIGLGPVNASYLDINKVIDVAKQTNAQSIHPGYGFLSENYNFAKAVELAGLTFIGPKSEAIALMGSKSVSKKKMLEAKVPCIPGYQGDDQSDNTLLKSAKKIGFPLMIKASAGGGGRGMRLVNQVDDLKDALKIARAEALNAFGSSELILEKAFVNARHIEIQIISDAYGSNLYFGERDCSIQRRHQKVIEESPSPVMTKMLREKMGKAAVCAAKAVDYTNAGTIEFLVDDQLNYYFLEMNTRIQVEHPVTEMVTGYDLIALQFLVAQGAKLPMKQSDIAITGHAIEARIYAEDPNNDFLPNAGKIDFWDPPRFDGVRIDDGVVTGQTLSTFYDPMIAKFVGFGENRESARQKLIQGLTKTALFGIKNNKQFLIECLRKPSFIGGDFKTDFISKEFQDQDKKVEPKKFLDIAIVACIQVIRDTQNLYGQTLCVSELLCNWTNAGCLRYRKLYMVGDDHFDLTLSPVANKTSTFDVLNLSTSEKLSLTVEILDDSRARCLLERNIIEVAFFELNVKQIYCEINGLSRLYEDMINNHQGGRRIESSGTVVSPMHGSLLEVNVNIGENVVEGQLLAVLEAMKMHYEIRAEISGQVEAVFSQKGDQISADDVLLEIKDR